MKVAICTIRNMYRRLVREFGEGSLLPKSRLVELPHIGQYLYARLVATYRPRGRDREITLRQFANVAKRMTTAQLKASLQQALKNERANLCVGRTGSGKYHVRDVNEPGFRTMVALLRVLKANDDGHSLGKGMVSNPTNIPYPKKRTEAAKYTPCKGRRACKSAGLKFKVRQCMYTDPSGFEGMSPLPGQQIQSHSKNVLDRKTAMVQKVLGVTYTPLNTHTRQRVPGKLLITSAGAR